MMTLLHSLQHDLQFAPEFFSYPPAKNMGQFIGRQRKYPQFAGALKKPADREIASKDKVLTIYDLRNSIETP